jgi:hypothetical protein
MSGTEPVSLAKLWLSAGELPRSGSIKQLWQWLADPEQTDVERVFLGSRSQPLSRRGGPEAVPGPDSVAEWLPLIACLLDHQPKVGSRGRHAAVSQGRRKAASDDELRDAGCSGRHASATLVLAILHGLLLDLLTTGDHTRVQQAFDLFETVLNALTGTPDP